MAVLAIGTAGATNVSSEALTVGGDPAELLPDPTPARVGSQPGSKTSGSANLREQRMWRGRPQLRSNAIHRRHRAA
ncbi:hypothetical protein AYJ54_13980 [Bradyrhizobium centrolobii]|uniref:Uncharacterized protein n=1 Tax=Bradyrhizobium centrolobii TaxID=1505087 RepID=A0A176YNH2_9BRAD|nr:hypothetical protein AYJ54_13980 [Bradyrhizobium centrolobii]